MIIRRKMHPCNGHVTVAVTGWQHRNLTHLWEQIHTRTDFMGSEYAEVREYWNTLIYPPLKNLSFIYSCVLAGIVKKGIIIASAILVINIAQKVMAQAHTSLSHTLTVQDGDLCSTCWFSDPSSFSFFIITKPRGLETS